MIRLLTVALAALLTLTFNAGQSVEASVPPPALEISHKVELGDTWTALAYRYGSTPERLLAQAGSINPQRNPVVGTTLNLQIAARRDGRFLRPLSGGLLELAARNGRNPWSLSQQNQRRHPYEPLLYTPLILPGGTIPPREFAPGIELLAISSLPARPGQVLALRARLSVADDTAVFLEDVPWSISRQEHRLTALGATGAFYPPGQPVLRLQVGARPLWEQPILLEEGDWTWEQVTFTNTDVLDPDAIMRERTRLQALWDEIAPQAHWSGPFQMPITDYLEITSLYGARRSVNGGPYDTYHEGTDFSAFRGSEVRAPAAGRVVLAEVLAIRGGSVILDHGLGLHSGYYHLSAIHVFPGQFVETGDLLGEVGSTGRSTGNHLHWDLLVGRTWVDPLAWLDSDIPDWLSNG
jgi:murein DD-endopeptidase MepM/ murein hydrolase activator NlpD